jgi:DnaJ-class molecular chaperone
MSENNYYQALDVQPDADEHEIKTSYRKLAFQYHPDRNKGNPGAASRMKSINEAYAVLSDPDKRRQYDMLCRRYGDGAQGQFRQTYSEAEIFKGSDIQQIYEEMARAFGLRGFDDIFKDFYGQGYRSFEFRQPGLFGKGFVFTSAHRSGGPGKVRQRIAGSIAQKVVGKLTGMLLPQQGGDLHGVIVLQPDFAVQGGPYAYDHRPRNKKLIVQIPKGVHDGQKIRLTGMGKEGTHGGTPGDLLLKVKIKTSLLNKLKTIMGVGGPRR